MIRLRRLGHHTEPFFLNPDLIVSIESTPDTVVTLTTHTKVLVAETPEEVVAAVRAWRSSVLHGALRSVPRPRGEAALTLVRGTATGPPPEDRAR